MVVKKWKVLLMAIDEDQLSRSFDAAICGAIARSEPLGAKLFQAGYYAEYVRSQSPLGDVWQAFQDEATAVEARCQRVLTIAEGVLKGFPELRVSRERLTVRCNLADTGVHTAAVRRIGCMFHFEATHNFSGSSRFLGALPSAHVSHASAAGGPATSNAHQTAQERLEDLLNILSNSLEEFLAGVGAAVGAARGAKGL